MKTRWWLVALLLVFACDEPRLVDQRVVRKSAIDETIYYMIGKVLMPMTHTVYRLHSLEGLSCTVTETEYDAQRIGQNFSCAWREQ